MGGSHTAPMLQEGPTRFHGAHPRHCSPNGSLALAPQAPVQSLAQMERGRPKRAGGPALGGRLAIATSMAREASGPHTTK